MNQSKPPQNLDGWIQRKRNGYSQGKTFISSCGYYFREREILIEFIQLWWMHCMLEKGLKVLAS